LIVSSKFAVTLMFCVIAVARYYSSAWFALYRIILLLWCCISFL